MKTSMVWRKLGSIFTPSGQRPWMCSHAQNPVAVPLDDSRVRVYFSSRDSRNRSHVTFIEIDIDRPARILRMASTPVLAPGPLGDFDDHGVYIGAIVRVGQELRMYFSGWNPGVPPLFYSAIGVAVSGDGGETFAKPSRAPILARDDGDPWMVAAPCVRLDGDAWRMWYVSGLRWEDAGDGLRSYYDIKHAASTDGLRWHRDRASCIALSDGERNISRACVLKNGDMYEAWYAFDRGLGYRIGCAESRDGLAWNRHDDEAGIDVSSADWEHEAIAYPWVFTVNDRKYMLYCGNRTGRSGLALAVCE